MCRQIHSLPSIAAGNNGWQALEPASRLQYVGRLTPKPSILMPRSILILATCLLLASSPAVWAATTLEQIQSRGFIRCGVHSSLLGFATPTGNGRWQGLEIDICKAIAFVLFDDAERVRWQPIAQGPGYARLQAGDIDILLNHNHWSPLLETTFGLLFTTPTYFASQGVMVRAADNHVDLDSLSGITLCTMADSPLPATLSDTSIKRLDYPSYSVAGQAFKNNLCSAFLAPTAELYQFGARQQTPAPYTLLASFEPAATGPLVRGNDLELFKLIRLVIHTLIAAEQLDISSRNIASIANNQTPAFIQLLELTVGGIGFGLSPDWAVDLIKQMGNYSELFDRHLGEPYQMPRAYNALSTDGGLHWFTPLSKIHNKAANRPQPNRETADAET